MSERVLVVGATSGIARAIARRLASEGTHLVLAGRRVDDLQREAADLGVRGAGSVAVEPFDALALDEHEAFVERCWSVLGGELDGVVICHGVMADQEAAQRDFGLVREMIDVNFTSVVSLLERLAARMERRGSGWLCALSSVAGDRGRRKNYLYGATKGALHTYLEGLDARLSASGVRVVAVRPGPVETEMTFGRADAPAMASPEQVADDIVRAIHRGRARVYTPWFWWPIMSVIRHLPTSVFRRLSF